jgi:hypothetical protein
MKTKEELVELGMYPDRRDDVIYIVGYIYDLLPEINSREELKKKIEEVRTYLDKNRGLINNYNGNIALTESIIGVLRELGAIETKKYNKNNITSNKTGIYGIYIEDELVYIGKTDVGFQKRLYMHKYSMEHIEKSGNKDFYTALKKASNEGKEIKLVPLVVIEDLKVKGHDNFTFNDIKMMELSLITAIKPKYNIEGVHIPYDFSHK